MITLHLNLLMVVLALTLNLIKKPQENVIGERFRFNGAVTSETDVENPDNWVSVISSACFSSSADDIACELVVTNIFYHSHEEDGTFVLNTIDPDGAGPDQMMVIAAASGGDSGKYIVVASDGSKSSTAIYIFNEETP